MFAAEVMSRSRRGLVDEVEAVRRRRYGRIIEEGDKEIVVQDRRDRLRTSVVDIQMFAAEVNIGSWPRSGVVAGIS